MARDSSRVRAEEEAREASELTMLPLPPAIPSEGSSKAKEKWTDYTPSDNDESDDIISYADHCMAIYDKYELVEEDLLEAFQEDFANFDLKHFQIPREYGLRKLCLFLRSSGIYMPIKTNHATYATLLYDIVQQGEDYNIWAWEQVDVNIAYDEITKHGGVQLEKVFRSNRLGKWFRYGIYHVEEVMVKELYKSQHLELTDDIVKRIRRVSIMPNGKTSSEAGREQGQQAQAPVPQSSILIPKQVYLHISIHI